MFTQKLTSSHTRPTWDSRRKLRLVITPSGLTQQNCTTTGQAH